MGCDVSHFNVSFIVRGKVSKAVSINHNCWRERRAEVELSWGSSVYEPYRWAKWLMRWSHTAFLLHHFLTNLPSDRASYTMTDWLGCMIIGQEWRKWFFYTQSFNQTEGCGSLMENQQRASVFWCSERLRHRHQQEMVAGLYKVGPWRQRLKKAHNYGSRPWCFQSVNHQSWLIWLDGFGLAFYTHKRHLACPMVHVNFYFFWRHTKVLHFQL